MNICESCSISELGLDTLLVRGVVKGIGTRQYIALYVDDLLECVGLFSMLFPCNNRSNINILISLIWSHGAVIRQGIPWGTLNYTELRISHPLVHKQRLPK